MKYQIIELNSKNLKNSDNKTRFVNSLKENLMTPDQAEENGIEFRRAGPKSLAFLLKGNEIGIIKPFHKNSVLWVAQLKNGQKFEARSVSDAVDIIFQSLDKFK